MRSKFLSTPSARRATDPRVLLQRARTISIHALCEEGDFLVKLCITVDAAFLSTPSARRATAPIRQSASLATNFYPRPLRGGRPLSGSRLPRSFQFLSTPSARRATHGLQAGDVKVEISIHALCEEGDPPKAGLQAPHGDFYPRPLRGGRPTKTVNRSATALFLSTPSARRATLDTVVLVLPASISIHALCEEGDRRIGWRSPPTAQFLSTPSARRATCL